MKKRDQQEPEDELINEEAQQAYEEHRASLPMTVTPPPKPPDNFSSKRSKGREDIVILWLERGYSLGRAADEADINRTTLREWRAKDEAFNRRVEEAIERGTDLIEDEARRRATDGIDEPVFQQGGCVGFKRVYSDSLMLAILGGRRVKYSRQRMEHVGADGAPIEHKIEVEFVKGER